MPAVKDLSKLLDGLPKGSWVAVSHDEEKVLAFDAQFEEARKKAIEAGEQDPIMLRVPQDTFALIL